jgi:hypothetical protein
LNVGPEKRKRAVDISDSIHDVPSFFFKVNVTLR